jgi:hypothetical protein
MKPKREVLQFIDSLSPYQWRTYLSYIIQPTSKLPDGIRVDLINASLGEGRCSVVACFEEAFDEVKRYVDRVCDLKMNFEVVPSSQATLARLRDAIERKLLLVVGDLENLSGDLLQEYLSLSRYRVSGSLGVSSDYGMIIFGGVVRRTKYGNPEAATYNKLGRGVYNLLREQGKAFGFHMVFPDHLEKQRKPVLEPAPPFSDAYLVSSFFSRYKEKFIVDTGIQSLWR